METGTIRVTEWTVGWATLGFPSPRPSPLGRGRIAHRFLITPMPEIARRPSAKHQSDACCSLSLRERVRVRGNYSVEHDIISSSPRDAGAGRGPRRGASNVPPLPGPLLHQMEEREFRCFRLRLAAMVRHRSFLSLPICFLLLIAPVPSAQGDTDADPLP